MTSIAKRPNGRWRARYVDAAGKEHARHFDRKADAERWRSQQVTKVADGTWIDPQAGRRTFAAYAQQWTRAQVHHRPSTAAQTRYRLEHYLLPHFGARPLVAIQRTDVQAWVRTLSATLAPSHVEALYRLLAQVMLAAVDDRVLSHTPCRKVQLPERPRNRVRIPTTEEVAAVMGAASAHGRPLVATAVATGMRVSELCGLTIDRVDFLRGTVTVDRQLLGTNARSATFGPPKTKASHRTIPVPQSLIDLLAAHLAEHPSADHVFRTARGNRWVRRSVAEEWATWCGAAGVRFRFHDLRHFYASALIAAGQSVRVVQDRLGHASATVTLDTYAHLWPADEDATKAAVDGVLGEVYRTESGLAARMPRSGA